MHQWQRPGSVGSSGSSYTFSPSSGGDSLFTSPSSSGLADSDSSLNGHGGGAKKRLKSETVTSPDSGNGSSLNATSGSEDSKASIPVGIAVGRQRPEMMADTKPSTAATVICGGSKKPAKELDDNKSNNSSSTTGSDVKDVTAAARPPRPPPPAELSSLDYMAGLMRQYQQQASGGQVSVAAAQQQQPPLWPLSYMQPNPLAAAAAAAPQLGYQLAKDPLTGQVYFVPGSTYGHLAHIWPAAAAAAAMTATPFAAAAAAAAVTPFQQSLMQLQHESWMARQGFLYSTSSSTITAATTTASTTSQVTNVTQPPERPRPPSPPTRSPLKEERSPINPPPPTGSGSASGNHPESDDQLSIGDPAEEAKLATDNKSTKPSVKVESNPSETRASKSEEKSKPTSSLGFYVEAEAVKREIATPASAMSKTPNGDEDDEVAASETRDGLQLLAEGIDRLEKLKTEREQQPKSPSKLGLLCDAAFLSDDELHRTSSSLEDNKAAVAVRSRSLDCGNNSNLLKSPSPRRIHQRTLSSDYRSPKAERNAKAFIASKSLKMSDTVMVDPLLGNPPGGAGNPNPHLVDTMLADIELKFKGEMAKIQKEYKEKSRELHKLNHQVAKKERAHSLGNLEAAAKSKTPTKDQNHSHLNGGQTQQPSKVNGVKKKTLALNPWLQSIKWSKNSDQSNKNKSTGSGSGSGGESPKMAAPRTAPAVLKANPMSGPDLSSITAKFKSTKPNPFENLLKLSSVKKQPVKSAIDEENGGEIKMLPKLDAVMPAAEDHDADVSDSTQDESKEDSIEYSDGEDSDDLPPPVLEPMGLETSPPKIKAKPPSPKKSALTMRIMRRSLSSGSRSPSPPPRAKKPKKDKKAKKAKKEKKREQEKVKRVKVKSIVVPDEVAPDCIDLVQPTGNTKSSSKKAKKVRETYLQGKDMRVFM